MSNLLDCSLGATQPAEPLAQTNPQGSSSNQQVALPIGPALQIINSFDPFSFDPNQFVYGRPITKDEENLMNLEVSFYELFGPQEACSAHSRVSCPLESTQSPPLTTVTPKDCSQELEKGRKEKGKANKVNKALEQQSGHLTEHRKEIVPKASMANPTVSVTQQAPMQAHGNLVPAPIINSFDPFSFDPNQFVYGSPITKDEENLMNPEVSFYELFGPQEAFPASADLRAPCRLESTQSPPVTTVKRKASEDCSQELEKSRKKKDKVDMALEQQSGHLTEHRKEIVPKASMANPTVSVTQQAPMQAHGNLVPAPSNQNVCEPFASTHVDSSFPSQASGPIGSAQSPQPLSSHKRRLAKMTTEKERTEYLAKRNKSTQAFQAKKKKSDPEGFRRQKAQVSRRYYLKRNYGLTEAEEN